MNAILLAAALVFGAPQVEDGGLLFLQNSNRFVELYTGSGVTHVAMVLYDDEDPWVYEATPGHVRKVELDAFCAEMAELNRRREDDNQIRMWVVNPQRPYTKAQKRAMQELFESQLGRRYSIKGYIRGRSDGIHCAEICTRALCAASVLDVERPQEESPGALYHRVRAFSRSAHYPLPPAEKEGSWCERSRERWQGYGSWCSWSCWETLTFCW